MIRFTLSVYKKLGKDWKGKLGGPCEFCICYANGHGVDGAGLEGMIGGGFFYFYF